MTEPLRVAIIGCGQIADAHIKELKKIGAARLVSVCDRSSDLAERAARVFDVPTHYTDFNEMIRRERPDVVHITTPAMTHKDVALQCLDHPVHLYVEKPFTIDANDAKVVLDKAARAGVQVCVGHNELYDVVWQRLRQLIARGDLGEIRHVESLQGYDLSGPFGALVKADPEHWVHKLPGGVFHNTISHPAYKITDCLNQWSPQVDARWFRDPTLDAPIPVELRVAMNDGARTASLWVSSRIRPVQRVVRIYGTQGSVAVDCEAKALYGLIGASTRGPFIPLEHAAKRMCGSATTLLRHCADFLRNRIHFFHGMNGLFTAFYACIARGDANPTPPEEIIRVTKIMDDIFASCRTREGAP